jgi:anti-sigma regulatory factor (Ser/Thr protein kinase)
MRQSDFGRRILNTVLPARAPEIRVKLPYGFKRESMFGVIDATLNVDLTPKASRFVFDFSQLRFSDPSAITVLSNLLEYLKRIDVAFRFENHKLQTTGNKYLDDSGFFRAYSGEDSFSNALLRGTTLPLELIKHEKSFSWINNTFAPWMAARAGLSEKSLGTIKLCLMEIFNNIGDHSGEKNGCAFAQHYPNKQIVMLSISDFGVGIPTNVRKKLPHLNDSQAINKATEEGFTTQSTQRNRGAGLAIMMDNVVAINHGKMWINSLTGGLKCIHAASGVRKAEQESKISYPGTLLEMEFNTAKLDRIVKEEEFEW